MIELPEAAVLARQLNATICQKKIRTATAGHSPHKFAWYSGDPAGYGLLLKGRTIGTAASHGGMVEIEVEDVSLLFGDGVNLHFQPAGEEPPAKHQLLVEFEDGSALSGSVAMYGGLWCFSQGTNDNPYYLVAREKPSPLAAGFSWEYFLSLFTQGCEKLPLKGFLATQQRIPGLGNGVLQDILYRSGLHPKRKVAALGESEREALFQAVKTVLGEMAEEGGRDTERDLYGNPGGYRTRMSKNTAGTPCPICGCWIEKQSYMGGSIYFCPGCQREN